MTVCVLGALAPSTHTLKIALCILGESGSGLGVGMGGWASMGEVSGVRGRGPFTAAQLSQTGDNCEAIQV